MKKVGFGAAILGLIGLSCSTKKTQVNSGNADSVVVTTDSTAVETPTDIIVTDSVTITPDSTAVK